MTSEKDVVIASAARTPVGAFNGGLSALPASELGKAAIIAALERAGVSANEVNEVVMGQILTAGTGQNPARQAAVGAGVPVESTALVLNQLCGSGLRAVAAGYQAIRNEDADIVVAGGQESMSQAPHCAHLRDGHKLGGLQMIDSMLVDGLLDVFNGYHMGNTAENVASKFGISREIRKSTRLNSSHITISYAVFCLKKKNPHINSTLIPSTPFFDVKVLTYTLFFRPLRIIQTLLSHSLTTM